MIKLSQTSKMPCPSWSLPALASCPGARRAGQVVPACRGCYALQGRYLTSSVRAARAHNAADWQRPEWAGDMVTHLRPLRLFRWFDSGDLVSVALAEKILEVAQRTPATRHWLPTRSGKLARFRSVIAALEALPNMALRHSSDRTDGIGADVAQRPLRSVIAGAGADPVPAGAVLCRAGQRSGECAGCRACWSSGPMIVYPQHGTAALSAARLEV